MTLAEIRRLAEKVMTTNKDGGFVIPARVVLRLLAVVVAATEYRALWLHVHDPEPGGEPTTEERVRLGYVRGELFAQVTALEKEEGDV